MSNTSVTICIPVFNEVQFIKQTLCSALGQTDEIVISDNGSTDGTTEICKNYAAKYGKIIYFRFEKTVSPVENFMNAVSLASSDFFMFLGGHDLIAKNHVKKMKEILDKNTDAVLAYSNAVHLDSDYAFNHAYDYDSAFLESNSASERVFSIIRDLYDCTIYHGLYRKSVFCSCVDTLSKHKYASFDHGLLAEVVVHGKALLCANTTYYRVQPRDEDATIFASWTRVMKTFYNDAYDSETHIPELFPIGVATAQFKTAEKVAERAESKEEFLRQIAIVLLQRWGVNVLAREEIERVLGNYKPKVAIASRAKIKEVLESIKRVILFLSRNK